MLSIWPSLQKAESTCSTVRKQSCFADINLETNSLWKFFKEAFASELAMNNSWKLIHNLVNSDVLLCQVFPETWRAVNLFHCFGIGKKILFLSVCSKKKDLERKKKINKPPLEHRRDACCSVDAPFKCLNRSYVPLWLTRLRYVFLINWFIKFYYS